MDTSPFQHPESAQPPAGKPGSPPSTSPSTESPEYPTADPDGASGGAYSLEHGDLSVLLDPNDLEVVEDPVGQTVRTNGDKTVQNPPLISSSLTSPLTFSSLTSSPSVAFTVDFDEPLRSTVGNDPFGHGPLRSTVGNDPSDHEPLRSTVGSNPTGPEDNVSTAPPFKATRFQSDSSTSPPTRPSKPAGRRTEHVHSTPWAAGMAPTPPVTPVSIHPSLQPSGSSISQLRMAQDQIDFLKKELRRLNDEAATSERKVDEGLQREAALLQNQDNLTSERAQSEDAQRLLRLQNQKEFDLLQGRLDDQKAENVRLANHRAQQRKAQVTLQEQSSRQAKELADHSETLSARDREINKLKSQLEGSQSALNVTEARLQQFSTDLRAEKSAHQADISTFQMASKATNQRHTDAWKQLAGERDRILAEKAVLQQAQTAAEKAATKAEAERATLLLSQQQAAREQAQAKAEKTALLASHQQAEKDLIRIQAERADLLASQRRAEKERARIQAENAVLLSTRIQAEENQVAAEAERTSLLASQKRAEKERNQAEAERASHQSARERAEHERALVEEDNLALLASKKQIEKDRAQAEAEKAALLHSHRLAEEASSRKSQADSELLNAVAILTARFDSFENDNQRPSMSQQFDQMRAHLLQSFHIRPKHAGRHGSGESLSSGIDTDGQADVNPPAPLWTVSDPPIGTPVAPASKLSATAPAFRPGSWASSHREASASFWETNPTPVHGKGNHPSRQRSPSGDLRHEFDEKLAFEAATFEKRSRPGPPTSNSSLPLKRLLESSSKNRCTIC